MLSLDPLLSTPCASRRKHFGHWSVANCVLFLPLPSNKKVWMGLVLYKSSRVLCSWYPWILSSLLTAGCLRMVESSWRCGKWVNADEAIQKHVLATDWFRNSQRVCAYVSCASLREVETSKIVAYLLQRQHEFPGMSERDIMFLKCMHVCCSAESCRLFFGERWIVEICRFRVCSLESCSLFCGAFFNELHGTTELCCHLFLYPDIIISPTAASIDHRHTLMMTVLLLLKV